MFKNGDKVVCILTKTILDEYNQVRGCINNLKLNGVYTIQNKDGGRNDIELVEVPFVFYQRLRFKSLTQFRKEKIEKICTQME